MKRHLKLQHHKHTGKLIHHRHTSYGALSILVVIAALLAFMTGQIARADDLLVTATVPAPIPSGKPAFTAPQASTTTTTASVAFEGTCPVIDPAIIIALYDQAELLGSGACTNDGTFQITATLSPGAHVIIARVVTITNEIGESSDPLTITYASPTLPPSTPVGSSRPAPVGSISTTPVGIGKLEIIADKPFLSFGVQNPVRWSGAFRGGVGPYQVTIDWGDGVTTKKSAVGSEPFNVIHTYQNHHIYFFSITLTDASGHTLTRSYVSMPLGIPPSPGQTPIVSITRTFYDPTLFILSLYAAIAAFIALLWRYEHVHYRNLIGVPIHYGWQTGSKKPRKNH